LIGQNAAAYVAEEGKVSAAIGLFTSKTDFGTTPSGDSVPRYDGMGLVVNGDAYSGGGLEIALFVMSKAYVREVEGKFLAEKTRLLHITMGYRWYLSELYSFSAALSSGYAMGDPAVMFSDFAPNANPDTSARDVVEYGLDLSFQAELWAKGANSIVVDLRYCPSLTPKENEHASHLGGMIAFKQVIQEKSNSKK